VSDRSISIPAVAGPLIPRVRCAPFHEGLGADPIGSAGAYDGFLVCDVGLPWASEVTAQSPLQEMISGPAGSVVGGNGDKWRVIARVPAPERAADGLRRITEHRVRRCEVDGLAMRGPFVSREWIVAPERVIPLGRAILGLGQLDGQPPVDPAELNDHVEPATMQLAMCTHGSRDTCCGGVGTHLYEALAGTFARSGATVRRERISHTGGHRFAPTAITFPDGYAWAHLDEATCELIVSRAEPPERCAEHCRGSSFLAGAPAQAADRAALVAVGWDWADAARGVQLAAFDRSTMSTTVRISGLLPDGQVRSFDVTSAPDRHIPSPTCGGIDRPEYKTDTVWRVDRVDEVDAASV